MSATVYLIPTVLHEGQTDCLPQYLLPHIQQCSMFFVEQERTARRFLKLLWKEMVIDDYAWHNMQEVTADVRNSLVQAIKAGKTIGIISEAGCPGVADPGQALVAALYIEGGIRSVEIGSLMFGKYDADGKLIPAAMELVRLAIPRRVYTQSHIDYVAEVIIDVFKQRKEIKGMKIIEEAPTLRHFTAKMKWLNNNNADDISYVEEVSHHRNNHKFKIHNRKIY